MRTGGIRVSDDTEARESRALSGRRLGAAALLLGASVLMSRVLGFVRDMVLAHRLGVGEATDAFSAAFQIPDLLNYLLAGGALAIAFTPLYLRALQGTGPESAARLFHTVLGTLGSVTVLLTVLLWAEADAAIAFQFPGFDPETRALTTRLTRIVLPAQVFFVTGGIVRAVLMAHGRFGAQAAAPLIYNGAIIAGGLMGSGVEGFAWGALAGAFVGQLVVPLAQLRGVSTLGLRIAPLDPRFRTYLLAALPLMVGVSLTTVDEWYERWFGQAIGVGVVASLAFARRLMMAPVAVVGQAVATAALPTLAALHAEGRSEELDRRLLQTLRGTLAVAVWTAGALVAFAGPIVTLVYQRGRFDAEDTARVAALLGILAFAVPGWVTQQVAVRAFFARGEMWRPMLLGTAAAGAAIPLYQALGAARGAEGLALAGAIAISANAMVTVVWARVRFGGPPLLGLAATGVRALAITAVAGWVGRQVAFGGAGTLGLLADLGAGGLVYGALVLIGTVTVGDAASREAVARLWARVRRSRAAGAPGPRPPLPPV
jgi:putative peptidoglycan lipid II flippase